MNFDLKTDKEYLAAVRRVEEDVDAIIDSAKSNLTRSIGRVLQKEGDGLTGEVLDLVYADLEEKRKNIKSHFVSQLSTLTEEAYQKALSEFSRFVN